MGIVTIDIVAFTFTASWGALTTLLGTLLGVVITALVNGRNERMRLAAVAEQRQIDWQHEQALRDIDQAEAHRARLYASRQVTYAQLRRHYLTYRRLAIATVETADKLLDPADSFVQPSLEAQERLLASADETHAARTQFDDALADAEALASKLVQDAIAAVRRAVDALDRYESQATVAAGLSGRGAAEHPGHSGYDDARARLDDAELALRAAVRAELRLDD